MSTKDVHVLEAEDTNGRTDGMLYFLQLMTPPGSSNGFVDFPLVKNATESMILLDFTASKAGHAWISILPSSLVSSATAASIMWPAL